MSRLKAGWWSGIWLSALVLLLAACASVPETADGLARPNRMSIQRFSLDGRISVRDEGRTQVGVVAWQHAPDRDEIMISTPLGQGIASLTGVPGEAVLELADRRRFVASDLESLSQQVFGVALPLAHMPIWVLGRQAGNGAVEADSKGRPVRIREAGWFIDYRAWESGLSDALPKRIVFQRGEMEVNLVVDAWNLPEGQP